MTVRTLLAAVFFSAWTVVSAAPVITVSPDTAGSSYIPLSAFGIAPIANMGDESLISFQVGSFVYAGQSWDSLGISSNGYVVVGPSSTQDNSIQNQAFPNAARPNNVLAPFWTDLDPSVGGAVRLGTLTDGIKSWIVVDWDMVPLFASSTFNSFELWIGINGVEDIWFTYGAVSRGSLGELTIGAEDATGTVGALAYYNGAGSLPGENDILRVSSSGFPEPSQVPEPTSIALLGIALVALASARRRKLVR